MTKLEQLIKELCPNGVKYVAIKDYFTRLKGTPITAGKMKEIESPDGEIRIFAGGKTVINAHEKDIPNANITRVPAVLVQSRGVIDFIYYEKPFTFKNEMWAYTAENKITVKYLYYFLQNNTQHFRDSASGMGSLPQISLHVTEDFKILVPPIEIQVEIVKILDEYSTSVTALQQGLEKELTARKKQYEYYRDLLLDFGVHGGGGTSEREWRTLGEIATIVRGASPRPIKNFVTDDKNGVHWIKIGDVLPDSKYITATQERITPDGAAKSRFVHKGDFILSNSMSFGRPYILQIDGCIHDGWLSISDFEDYVSSDYLYHILTSGQIQQEMKKRASFGGAVQNLNSDIVKAIEIPIPKKSEQDRIVSILDRFDKLCNDISEGLPAEIEARRKQYEYYRDRLLSFEERKNA